MKAVSCPSPWSVLSAHTILRKNTASSASKDSITNELSELMKDQIRGAASHKGHSGAPGKPGQSTAGLPPSKVTETPLNYLASNR